MIATFVRPEIKLPIPSRIKSLMIGLVEFSVGLEKVESRKKKAVLIFFRMR